MLSEQQQIILQEPKFIEKLQRMEVLGIQLGKLLGQSILTLGRSFSATGPNGKALGHSSKDGKWFLMVDWRNYDGHDKVTCVTLNRRTKGWIRYKQVTVMDYQRSYGSGSREETRLLSVFDDSVVAVLDTLSDELEEQIARASRATQKHREQFREVVEERLHVERSRFDQIDLRP